MIFGFFKRHKLGLLSFFLPFLILLAIFAGRRIYPFGDRSFLHSDMYHQYMPFFAELMHKIKSGDSLFYSWNIGIGTNFLALFVYYLASPFNWLLVFVPERFLMEFMSYLIVVKMSLCGVTFGIYLRRHFHTRSYKTVLFSTLYALSGFLAAYNWDIMWLDNVILAPLIILGLERLFFQKKYMLYCLTLAMSILSNYYISIMICIYLVLYFGVLLMTHPERIKAIFPFAGYSLLAGGLSGILLIPELVALHFTEFSEIKFPTHISSYFSLLDMLARHFVNVTTEQGLKHWPNIYCGVIILLLLPLYVLNKKIRLSEKIAKLTLLFFLLISFSTNVLNFLWHGLNYPDSLPCRQSFLYILLLLTLCYEALNKLNAVSSRELIFVFWGCFFFVMLCERVLDNQEAFPASSFLMTYCLLAVYTVLLLWYHHLRHRGIVSAKGQTTSHLPAISSIWGKRRSKPSPLQVLAILSTCIVVLESGMNMAVTSVSTTSRTKYLEHLDAYRSLVEHTRQQDPDFYRFEKIKRTTKNDGALVGYPTASLFSSTGNSYVGDLYEQLGMSESKVFYCHDGATPLTSSLLAVGYVFSSDPLDENLSDLYEPVDSQDGIYLYRNRYALPLGFMISGTLDEALSYPDYTPLEVQNRLAAALLAGQSLFVPVSTDTEASFAMPDTDADSQTTTLPPDIPSDEPVTYLTATESGHYYGYINQSGVKTVVARHGEQKKEFTRLNHNYILDLGYLEAGETMVLTNAEKEDLTLSAYRLNTDTLDQVIQKLKEQPFVTDSYTSTTITGHIQVEKPGQLLLTIPYEPGWTVYIDGVKCTSDSKYAPKRFANTFLALPLEQGTHTISLRYFPAGFLAGIALTTFSLLVLLLLTWTGYQKKRKSAS